MARPPSAHSRAASTGCSGSPITRIGAGAVGADVEPLVPTADPSFGTHVSSRGVAANCAGDGLCLMTMHGTASSTTPEKSVRVVCRQS